MAVEILKNEFEKIKIAANPAHKLEYDLQVASGSFSLFRMASVYQGVQNVVVKLSPANGIIPKYSLLVNSHFDTVPVSYGAGDAGIMIGVMFEVLRVITSSNVTYDHSIVFLFNGAEENSLHGSHGFITQHKWAKDVRAFINLDSSGTEGRELLYKLTPNHAWLMDYYKSNAKHPFSLLIAEELYEANFIPSDTDFRIFRDYGKIAGDFKAKSIFLNEHN